MSIVRENLMTRPGYTPYCGADDCRYRWPRTVFNGRQFECLCGWTSSFTAQWIDDYKKRWNLVNPTLDRAKRFADYHEGDETFY